MTPPEADRNGNAAIGKRLLAIVGATASGKSAAAVLAATRFSGEVVNADSRLFYRGMEIGTASPTPETLASVPHHLVGFIEPHNAFSLPEFIGGASAAIRQIHRRGMLPVVAGGTGQYVWGLLEGWSVPEIPPDPELRAGLEDELQLEGVEALFSRLQKLAPEVAARTDPRNHRRVIRALERVAAGDTGGERKSVDPGYDSLVIGLRVERAELHRRIVERIDRMLSAGWVGEVERLLNAGVNPSSSAFSAIGYREIAAVLRGEQTLDAARESTIHATNRLLRHQNNWFKQPDERIKWVDVTDGVLERALEPVQRWLEH